MSEAISVIIKWIHDYYTDGFYLVLMMISIVYLFIYDKGLRKKFLGPLLILAFFIFNPVLYRLFYHKIIYWRLFWMIPDAIIIALAMTRMLQACRKKWEKSLALIMLVGIILMEGSNVYVNGGFERIRNWSKLPEPVEEVCETMLEIDETPYCVVPEALIYEVRQYCGDIHACYGRNAQGYIGYLTKWQKYMYLAMEQENPDYDYILDGASRGGYDFVVTYETKAIREDILNFYGYIKVDQTEGYCIYYSEECHMKRELGKQ